MFRGILLPGAGVPRKIARLDQPRGSSLTGRASM